MKKSLLIMAPLLFGPLVFGGSLSAQQSPPAELPGQADPARVAGGTYALDKAHTQVSWQVNHFGFNDYFGLFGDITGTLSIDPANPSAAKVDIEIPITSVATSSAGLTTHLKTADFFDAEKFPSARFVSTAVTVDGNLATISGNLTMLGITKPVVLETTFTGAGSNPFNKNATIGFHAETVLKRSEWGMTKFVPLVGDEVYLRISAAFEKQG
ncbi:MAG: YceI family protein [Sphingorhabdus sp.]|nr:YceI family protein [Sphingorhabdus sp.]